MRHGTEERWTGGSRPIARRMGKKDRMSWATTNGPTFLFNLRWPKRFCVPCIVVSPWTAGGWVCSQPFDHTSVLRFLEMFTGVPEPNISPWRRSTFGDLTAALRLKSKPAYSAVLPDTSGILTLARYGAANLPKPVLPGGQQDFPQQEKGRRNRA